MTIEETILNKLSLIERFAVKAKAYLDWERDTAKPEKVIYMDLEGREALSDSVILKEGPKYSNLYEIKKLRAALLAFQRNGADYIELGIIEHGPIQLRAEKGSVYYSLAPTLEDD